MFNINEISNEDKDLVDAIQQQKIQNVIFHQVQKNYMQTIREELENFKKNFNDNI